MFHIPVQLKTLRNISEVMKQEVIQLLPIKTRREYIPVGSGAAVPAAHGLDRQQLSTSYEFLFVSKCAGIWNR